jgi:hypothetical protein
MSSRTARWVAAMTAAACIAVPAATARADLLGPAAAACGSQQLVRPFLPWLDPDQYFLAGDGGLEAGAQGWQLANGARATSGNEQWFVNGTGDTQSLYLPAGGVAVSPPACVELVDPTIRFFARSLGGTLKVDVTLRVAGIPATLPVGVVVSGSAFAPTPVLPLLANLTSPLAGGSSSVVIRFTALGGAVQVDDLFVDPFKVN